MGAAGNGAFFFALLSALLWGVGAVIEKVAMRGGDPMVGVFIRSCIAMAAGTLFFALGPTGWRGFAGTAPLSVLLFCLTGVTSMVVGQAFFFKALKLDHASRIVPISGTYPLIAAILSIVLLGEPFTAKKFLAVILIVTGIALLK